MSDTLPANVAAQIAEAVRARLGGERPELSQIVEQEVSAALGGSYANTALAAAAHERSTQAPERIVVTANGRNRAGVLARITASIDAFKGDIRDVSQTIVGDYFTAILVVDISSATSGGQRFAQLRTQLQQAGEDLGIHIVAIHDDMLSTMHRV